MARFEVGLAVLSATISSCGRYRYRLTRGDEPRLAFVMLNPSTADAEQDDPTIRRCLAFAKREGTKGIEVWNLFGLRATNPKELNTAADPYGPENDQHLADLAASRHRIVVCAWGVGAPSEAVIRALTILQGGFDLMLYCLGHTRDGSPRHPLYLAGDAPLVPWNGVSDSIL